MGSSSLGSIAARPGHAGAELAEHVDRFGAEAVVGDHDGRRARDRAGDEHRDVGDRMLRALGTRECAVEGDGEGVEGAARGGARLVVGFLVERDREARELLAREAGDRGHGLVVTQQRRDEHVVGGRERERRRPAVAGGVVLGRPEHAGIDEACGESGDRAAPEPGRGGEFAAGRRPVGHEVFEDEDGVFAVRGQRAGRGGNGCLADVRHVASMLGVSPRVTYPVRGT